MRVAVIGGGPSGLVTLKYLKTAHEFFPSEKPISAKLFERETKIGGAFKHRSYEDAEVCMPSILVMSIDSTRTSVLQVLLSVVIANNLSSLDLHASSSPSPTTDTPLILKTFYPQMTTVNTSKATFNTLDLVT